MGVSFGKWTKYNLMSMDERLTRFLPETQFFTKSSLMEMLKKYGQVMLKPCRGYQGLGIIQITDLNNGELELHIEDRKNIISEEENLYEFLRENYIKRKKRPYIIQQKIPLATINSKNPFDIRVMVQRKRNTSEWKVTGKLAKVAANNFVISNVAKTVLTVENVFEESSLSNENITEIINELDQVSLLIVQQLETSYPECRIYGIDLGIDQEGKIWIIEANLNPNISMFKMLENDCYETIRKYLKG